LRGYDLLRLKTSKNQPENPWERQDAPPEVSHVCRFRRSPWRHRLVTDEKIRQINSSIRAMTREQPGMREGQLAAGKRAGLSA
jgi:hypothetical protein